MPCISVAPQGRPRLRPHAPVPERKRRGAAWDFEARKRGGSRRVVRLLPSLLPQGGLLELRLQLLLLLGPGQLGAAGAYLSCELQDTLTA